MKEREAVHTSSSQVYQGKSIVGILVSTLVNAQTRASWTTRSQVKHVEHTARRVRGATFGA
jgi:hypothetical protein